MSNRRSTRDTREVQVSPVPDSYVVMAIVLAAVLAGLLLYVVTMLSSGDVGTNQPSAQSLSDW
jgi:hypothetical protein